MTLEVSLGASQAHSVNAAEPCHVMLQSEPSVRFIKFICFLLDLRPWKHQLVVEWGGATGCLIIYAYIFIISKELQWKSSTPRNIIVLPLIFHIVHRTPPRPSWASSSSSSSSFCIIIIKTFHRHRPKTRWWMKFISLVAVLSHRIPSNKTDEWRPPSRQTH